MGGFHSCSSGSALPNARARPVVRELFPTCRGISRRAVSYTQLIPNPRFPCVCHAFATPSADRRFIPTATKWSIHLGCTIPGACHAKRRPATCQVTLPRFLTPAIGNARHAMPKCSLTIVYHRFPTLASRIHRPTPGTRNIPTAPR